MSAILLVAKNVLGAVPGWVWALVCAGCMAFAGVQMVRASNAKASASAAQLEYANQRTTAAESYALAMRAKQYEGERRDREFAKAAAAGRTMLQTAQSDADRARAAGDSLRQQVRAALTAATSGRRQDSKVDTGSPATNQAADLLFDVFGRVDDAAGVIAEFADRSYAAAVTCERQADKLQPSAGR